ncbi:MAG: hypothetical protein JXR83_12145 [Deltaproteobacteria bacterium]|nr:hypothetical protein [Deltaproteobacteria bacterium]
MESGHSLFELQGIWLVAEEMHDAMARQVPGAIRIQKGRSRNTIENILTSVRFCNYLAATTISMTCKPHDDRAL